MKRWRKTKRNKNFLQKSHLKTSTLEFMYMFRSKLYVQVKWTTLKIYSKHFATKKFQYIR